VKSLSKLIIILLFFLPINALAGMHIQGDNITVSGGLFNLTFFRVTGASVSVYNSTLYDTEIEAAESFTLTNCIGYNDIGTKYDINITAAKTVTGNYNLFTDAAKSGSGAYTDTGTIWNSNPLFTNAGSDDFTLQAGSPACSGGIAISGYGTKIDWRDTDWSGGVDTIIMGVGIGAYACPHGAAGM